MTRAAPRALEAATVIAVLGFALLEVWINAGDPFRCAIAIASACVALVGVAVGEWAGARLHAPTPPPVEPPDTVLKDVMDKVASGLRNYLEEHSLYRGVLEGIDAELSALADPALAREFVSDLLDANRRIENRSMKLSTQLEAAREEILRLERTVEESERLALTDALTEVGNRRFFDRSLRADIAACGASGADFCFALADIDRFKSVNDRFGHVVGDHLLKAFAAVLTQGVKGRGKIARYGGEEFAMLFPGVPFAEARRIVEALRQDVEAKRWVVGPNSEPLGAVTASFGLAKLAPGETAESFVHRADSRLMRAKHSGRNRVVADDMNVGARQAS